MIINKISTNVNKKKMSTALYNSNEEPIYKRSISNVYEENRRIVNCDLNRFVCKCKFDMDIRGRCHPYKLSYGQNDEDPDIEYDSDNEDYREYKQFIDASYRTCPYKLQTTIFYIENDASVCNIDMEDETEVISFISSYETLFSLNEKEIQMLYKMMILDNNNYYYDSMEAIDTIYQKYLVEKESESNDSEVDN